MKYNDDGMIKEIKVKAFDTLPVGTEVDYDGQTVPDGWSEISSANIGTQANGFGDLMDAANSSYAVHFHGSWVATKISSNVWKFDIQGQISMTNPPSDYYTWGFSPTKISALLNTAIGIEVEYDATLVDKGQWTAYTTSGALRNDRVNYGTTFEYNSGYIIPSRYYNTTGSTGGWGLNRFSTDEFLTATLYLKEV